MPLEVVRLRDSELVMKTNGDEFRCAVILWCAAWHQVPAASLPDDDVVLADLAGFGRVVKEWRKVKAGALRGFVKCADGRLYHTVVAAKAIESWGSQLSHRWKNACDRIRQHNKRKKENLPQPDFDLWINGNCPEYIPYLSRGHAQPVTEDVVTESLGQPPPVTRETALKVREGKGMESSSINRFPGDSNITAPSATATAVGESTPEDPAASARIIAECERAKLEDASTGNAIVARWIRSGSTTAQVTLAIAEARRTIQFPKRLEAKYVDPILERIVEDDRKARTASDKRVADTTARNAEQRTWSDSTAPMPDHLKPRKAASA